MAVWSPSQLPEQRSGTRVMIVGEEEGKKVLLLLLRLKCEVILPSSSAIEGGRSPLPPGSQSGVDTVLC